MAMISKKNSNLLEQFCNPPAEYGPVDCWWWDAGKLDKEKITWQLEELKAKGVWATWYYPRFFFEDHPLSCQPHYFSKEWWEFNRFSIAEHERIGLKSWISDWTAHQYFQNKVRAERQSNPELIGRRLAMHAEQAHVKGRINMEIPAADEVIDIAAYEMFEDILDYNSRVDLNQSIEKNQLSWKAPETGIWTIIAVTIQPYDLDYLNRKVADRWLDHLMGTYKKELGQSIGKTVKALGPDETYLVNGNILYSPKTVERFKQEKGYNPCPYLVGLFHDIGDDTDRIRCDYYNVMVSELSENWYEPIPQWLHEHDMSYATIATFGRADILGQTYHYGDFFEMLKRFDIPGNEDPDSRPYNVEKLGERRIIDAKLASSVAHIYGTGRAAACVYWGSGWGHTQNENVIWTNENYAFGLNLYNRHGGLSSTMGGWYEWVPPAVHFRQPYWQYWKHFTDHITRLSFLMSQGTHQADVAILYPLTTMHANWSGGRNFSDAAKESAKATFDLAKVIYKNSIDFDFVDWRAIRDAKLQDGIMDIAGIEFRVALLPPMSTIRLETLRKLKEFYDGGGTIIAFGKLPKASAENGRKDMQVQSIVEHIFGTEVETRKWWVDSPPRRAENSNGGKGIFIPEELNAVPLAVSDAVERDIVCSEKNIFCTHQRTDGKDVYFVFNPADEKKWVSFEFRTVGQPEIFNSFTGCSEPIHRFEIQGEKTKVPLEMGGGEGFAIVFSDYNDRPAVLEDNLTAITEVNPEKDCVRVCAIDKTGGDKEIHITHKGREYSSRFAVDKPSETIEVEGLWDFELAPTMDNKWGDFRYPTSEEYIAAEARRFKYAEEESRNGAELGWEKAEFDDSNWQQVTYTYGPYYWTIGPFDDGTVPQELLEKAKAGDIDSNEDCQNLRWQRYEFSQKFGYEGADVHNNAWGGMGGMCGVNDNFIVFDDITEDTANTARCLFAFVHSPEKKEYFFNFGVKDKVRRRAWINGELVVSFDGDEGELLKKVTLRAGLNKVLIEVIHPEDKIIRTFAAFQNSETEPDAGKFVPLLKWFTEPTDLVYDIMPDKEQVVGWYRFKAPPGLKSMNMNLKTEKAKAWVNGEEVSITNDKITLDSPIAESSQVALRVVQSGGCYGGAVFELPVMFNCEQGKIGLGDWCDYGLENYSGGAIYSNTVTLEKAQLAGRVILDLGAMPNTAELWINDKEAGFRMHKPFRFDITDFVNQGQNQIKIKVVNTLANHMSTYPTKFVFPGQTVSGLTCQVKLEFLSQVNILVS